jgi:hypothetical protein
LCGVRSISGLIEVDAEGSDLHPPAIAAALRNLARAFVKKLPDLLLSAVGGFLRWYWSLTTAAMFFVTAVVGAGIVLGLGQLPTSSSARSADQKAAVTTIVAALILVILIGMIRPGRRRRR